jgi:NitT/TauT family transport system substrate-binding protein
MLRCGTFVAAACLVLGTVPVRAEPLTIAISGSHTWDLSVVEYGNRLGYFQENGLEVSVAATEIMSQNLQAVIAGSADIGIGAVSLFIAAAQEGAPVVTIASAFKGVPDFLWYVRSDSPIQSLRDVTEETTLGVSAVGSTSEIMLRSFFEQYGVSGTIVPVGNAAAGLTQVMMGQLDIGTDGNGLLGVPQYASGEIRPIAYGRDLEIMNDVTIRGFVVSHETLATRRDELVQFLKAYQKTIDWMYEDPQAIEWFAEGTNSSLAEATRVKENSYPEGHLNVEEITGLETTISQGLAFKRIEREPTEAELAAMFQTIWHRGMD